MDIKEISQDWTELDQISMRLQEDGLPPEASAKERQCHLWQLLLNSESKMLGAIQELQTLRTQQSSEMKEVESYVAHIRGLLEEREYLTAEYERESDELRSELHQIKHQQDVQNKELAEMLAQEDLGEIGLSSPSEQVAYLLVERSTLLERLEAAEKKVENLTPAGNSDTVNHEVEVDPTMGELKLQKELIQSPTDTMTKVKAHNEEITQERSEQQRLERDLEEASRRLTMAHQDIRRLTNELDAAKNNYQDQSESELEDTAQDLENLKIEVDELKPCDRLKLQQAKEQINKFDADNQALKERVQKLEHEKKDLLVQVTKTDGNKEDVEGEKSEPKTREFFTTVEDVDFMHKRCQEAVESSLVQVKELQRQLQKLRKDQEELEERNEELEALLGEAQNTSKEERLRHEGELEGLHRRIQILEEDLRKQDAGDKMANNAEEGKPDSFLQMQLRENTQERMALLEARLTEEKDWRTQLELDLGAAQAALKNDREALQGAERELKKLRFEFSGLQTECQQGKTLIKSLTQVKGEKTVLEEKMNQMQQAYSRLQSELERHKDALLSQEEQNESRLQVDQLQKQTDRLSTELGSLQKAHDSLRNEMSSERQRTAELQSKLNSAAQGQMSAEGQREKLEIEMQRLKQELVWHQDRLSSTQESLGSSQSEFLKTNLESGIGSLEKINDYYLSQAEKLEEESFLASQQQAVMKAQINEAQARIKSQDSVLNQKTEEVKQMKQDYQRAQSLFTSAEKELRYEKEKNVDLKKHNTLLNQENLKLSAELTQIQTRLVQEEQKLRGQVRECEHQQKKIKELELELARNSMTQSTTTSLQIDLQAERARLLASEKKVSDLKQQLKTAQHQLRMEEARADECRRLERDSRELSESLSALRAQQQEEHITRKLLEQREEDLQQQVKAMRLKEATLSRTNTELSHRAQQLDARLSIMETELSKAKEEAKLSQKSSSSSLQELVLSQQECERLEEELQHVLSQLNTHIRKYNEKQSHHKSKLHQAKQVFLKATEQRDATIRKLENDLELAFSLSNKEQERIHTVMLENEKLMNEKRELLKKIGEAEEMGSTGMRAASTVQHRVNVLEVENRQLQERSLKLSNQVGSLERALRSFESLYNQEITKKRLNTDNLIDNIIQVSPVSLSTNSSTVNIIDAICRVKVSKQGVADDGKTPLLPQQPSEQGYLNFTSQFLQPPPSKDPGEGSSRHDQI